MFIKLLMALCQVYSWLLIARVLLSWVNPRPSNAYLIMLCQVTDPVLDLFRPLNPIRGIDLSPILALLVMRLLCTLLLRIAT